MGPLQCSLTCKMLSAVIQRWLIPEDSAAYDYTIPDDDIFYIMATSGIYANQSDAFDDLTTNWIGMFCPAYTDLQSPLIAQYHAATPPLQSCYTKCR